jgi:hypothetical protein
MSYHQSRTVLTGLTDPVVYSIIVLFRFDLSAYILCLLNSIDLLASSIDDACAFDTGIAARDCVELICRRPRRDTILEVEAKGIEIGCNRKLVAIHVGHVYHQRRLPIKYLTHSKSPHASAYCRHFDV